MGRQFRMLPKEGRLAAVARDEARNQPQSLLLGSLPKLASRRKARESIDPIPEISDLLSEYCSKLSWSTLTLDGKKQKMNNICDKQERKRLRHQATHKDT